MKSKKKQVPIQKYFSKKWESLSEQNRHEKDGNSPSIFGSLPKPPSVTDWTFHIPGMYFNFSSRYTLILCWASLRKQANGKVMIRRDGKIINILESSEGFWLWETVAVKGSPTTLHEVGVVSYCIDFQFLNLRNITMKCFEK